MSQEKDKLEKEIEAFLSDPKVKAFKPKFDRLFDIRLDEIRKEKEKSKPQEENWLDDLI